MAFMPEVCSSGSWAAPDLQAQAGECGQRGTWPGVPLLGLMTLSAPFQVREALRGGRPRIPAAEEEPFLGLPLLGHVQ